MVPVFELRTRTLVCDSVSPFAPLVWPLMVAWSWRFAAVLPAAANTPGGIPSIVIATRRAALTILRIKWTRLFYRQFRSSSTIFFGGPNKSTGREHQRYGTVTSGRYPTRITLLRRFS